MRPTRASAQRPHQRTLPQSTILPEPPVPYRPFKCESAVAPMPNGVARSAIATTTIRIPQCTEAGGSREPSLVALRQDPRYPLHRALKLFRIACKAKPQEMLAAGAERGSRCHADIGLIDQPHHEATRIGFAVHVEKQIERALGPRKAHASGCGQHVARDVPPAPRALDQVRDETLAPLDRRDGGALHELRYARGRILDHVLDHLTELGMRRDPADAPAGHRPVLGERVDEQNAILALHDVEKRRRARAFAIP